MAKTKRLDPDRYTQELADKFDADTLDAGLSKKEAATVARQIASEFESRANGLEEEAEADGD